jgi:1,4-alpha-glucan branching enzyme
MSVYEMHLGSWKKHHGGGSYTYEEVADSLVEYVTDLGFTHVEFMPVMEHPFGGSWGYQVTSYFAPTARFGNPDGFRYLVDRLHQAGIGVLVDWVPAHFPKDEFALARFDGTPLYEDPNPSRGEHPDSGAARSATSWSPTPSTGSRSSTSTACGSTPSPPCSTSTTPASPGSGRPTCTAAARTSRRCSSCRR